jgi:hypothetical protein
MRSFAIACLTLAVVCLGGAKFANSAIFSSPQLLFVTGTFPGNLSQPCIVNVNANNAFACFPAAFNSYSFAYAFPLGAFYVFYLYDHNQARFVEAIIIRDVPLYK